MKAFSLIDCQSIYKFIKFSKISVNTTNSASFSIPRSRGKNLDFSRFLLTETGFTACLPKSWEKYFWPNYQIRVIVEIS